MMGPEEKAQFLSTRCGFLTASRMRQAMARKKDGSPAAERSALMRALLAERITGITMRNVVTPAMEEGIEFEDEAADKFVELTGRDLRLSHIYQHPTIEWFSATPDRELDDGLVEIKVPQPGTFIEWVLADVIPEQHKPQLIAQLLCSDKEWSGLIAYCPHIKDERRRLFMKKYVPTADERAAVLAAAVGFLDELDQMFDRFVSEPVAEVAA